MGKRLSYKIIQQGRVQCRHVRQASSFAAAVPAVPASAIYAAAVFCTATAVISQQ